MTLKWACEHGYNPNIAERKAKPYWQDILDCNNYCKRMGWVSYVIEHTDKGYTCNELKGYGDEDDDRK